MTWWIIIIAAILILVCAHFFIVSKTYECPECKARFHAKPYEVSAWIHDMAGKNGRRVVKCPKCGRRGFCGISDR